MTRTPNEIKKGISELEKLRDLITFNPATGEDIEPLFLSEENRALYDGVGVVLQYIQLLEAERDAAVKDIKQMVLDPYEPCFCDYCKLTEEECARSDCKGRSAFVWRGVQKEDSDAVSS